MSIKKILLVNPPQTLEERYGKAFSKIGALLPPIGLMYIAAMLEEKGYEARIVDTQLKNLNIEQAAEECTRIKPDLIGISCMTSNFAKSLALCSKLKEKMDAPIMIGGPHATIAPEDILKNKYVDFVVRGEGEDSTAELANALNSGKIKSLYSIEGIGFKDNGKIVLTKQRALMKDIDMIPFPARHLVKLKEYRPSPPHYKRLPTTTMLTSRGCPYGCTFCSNPIWGRSHRQRSVENVIKEIKHLIKEYGIRDINFWDDIFGINKKWLYEFCDAIKKEKIDITWHCEFRANLADKETLKRMAEAGCWAIFYGFESMDQEILDAINKMITPEQIRNAIKWTKDAGIEVRANFILGLPNETPAKARKMVRELTKMNPDYVKFNILTPYPSTELYNQISSGRWGEMTGEFNKLTGYFPTFRPLGYKNLGEVQKMRQWAYRKYYLRPGFILYKLSRIKSYDDLVRHIRGAMAILSL